MSAYFLRVVFMVTALLFFTGCLQNDGDTLAEENGDTLAEKNGEALRAAFDAALADTVAPGGILAVRFKDDSVLYHAVGVAELRADGPGATMTPNMAFRVGSNTKSMVGVLMLQLRDEGLLSLDDPIEDHLSGLLPRGDQITIRMLLDHTSGLFNYTLDEDWLQTMVTNPERFWTPEELLQIALAHDPLFEPGEEFYYSNTNYIILGMLMEQLTGQTARQLLAKRIFEPLKMGMSSLPDELAMPSPFMHGYMELSEELPELGPDDDVTATSPSIVWTAGGVIANAHDLLAFIHALAKGELLTPQSHAELLSFDPGGSYNLGVAQMKDGSIGHTGSIPGYSSSMYHFRDTDFVLTVNSQLYSTSIGSVYDTVKLTIFPDAESVSSKNQPRKAEQWTKRFF